MFSCGFSVINKSSFYGTPQITVFGVAQFYCQCRLSTVPTCFEINSYQPQSFSFLKFSSPETTLQNKSRVPRKCAGNADFVKFTEEILNVAVCTCVMNNSFILARALEYSNLSCCQKFLLQLLASK